jgi:hypothetical protein
MEWLKDTRGEQVIWSWLKGCECCKLISFPLACGSW